MRIATTAARGLNMDREVADAQGWLDQLEAQAVELGHVKTPTEFCQLIMLAVVYRLSDATHVHLAAPQLSLELLHHEREPAPTPPPEKPAITRNRQVGLLPLWELSGATLWSLEDLAEALSCTRQALKKRVALGQLVAHRQAGGGELFQVLPMDTPGRWMTLGELRHATGLRGKRLSEWVATLQAWEVTKTWTVYRAAP